MLGFVANNWKDVPEKLGFEIHMCLSNVEGTMSNAKNNADIEAAWPRFLPTVNSTSLAEAEYQLKHLVDVPGMFHQGLLRFPFTSSA